MKFKGTQKPSLIILGRTTLALMLLTIAAVSFGAGYLTGYQFTSSSHDDRPVMASTSRMVLPPDEKRVLEPTPPAPAQQPSQSQSQQVSAPPPKQDGQPLISVKPSAPEASAPPAQAEQKTAMAEKPAPAKPVAAPKPEESKKAPVTQVPPAPQAPAAALAVRTSSSAGWRQLRVSMGPGSGWGFVALRWGLRPASHATGNSGLADRLAGMEGRFPACRRFVGRRRNFWTGRGARLACGPDSLALGEPIACASAQRVPSSRGAAVAPGPAMGHG